MSSIDEMIDQKVAAAVAVALANLPVRPEPPALVTTRGLCEQIHASEATIHRMRARGLPCVMLGDSPRFSIAKVVAWLEARSSVSASAAE